ncbi:MAG: T9SS type A sorting domain-containing protein [Bacteroidales bacterium]
MKIKLFIITICCLAFSGIFNKAIAQKGFVSCGSNIISTEGSISYSAGLFDYFFIAGEEGSLTFGLQHSYDITEIIDTVNVDETPFSNLDVAVFPNPTSDQINISILTENPAKFSFLLFDMNGKLIMNEALTGELTLVPMKSIINGTYILEIVNSNRKIKSFKIIKN